MLPVLFSIGSFKLYSYGVFLFIALFTGIYWWWKLGRDENWEETPLFDTYFLALIGGFVVGRVVYILMNLEDFSNVYRMLGVTAFPGISLIGTLLGVVAVVFVSAYYQEWEIAKVLDNLAVTCGIVLVVGGVGAILNGSIPGIPVSWGIKYLGLAELRFPVDFVFFLWAIVNFLIVSRVRKNFRFYSWYKQNRTVAPDGLAALVGLLSLAMLYFLRGFVEEGFRLGPVPYYSLGGFVVVFIVGCVIYIRSGRTLFGKK